MVHEARVKGDGGPGTYNGCLNEQRGTAEHAPPLTGLG